MSDRLFRKGDIVEFDFTIEHPVAGRRGERRLGTGTIATDEVNYASWPPGYSVKVESSTDYRPGTTIAVASHNLRRLSSSNKKQVSKPKSVAHATKHARDPEWALGKVERIGDSSIIYYGGTGGRGHYQIRTAGKGLTGTAKTLKAARQLARNANSSTPYPAFSADLVDRLSDDERVALDAVLAGNGKRKVEIDMLIPDAVRRKYVKWIAAQLKSLPPR